MTDYAKFKVGEQWVARIYKGSTLIYELKQGGGETEEEFDARVRETIQGVIDGTISVDDCQTTGQEAAGKYPDKYKYAGCRNYSDIAAVSPEGDIVDWSAENGQLSNETIDSSVNLMSFEESSWKGMCSLETPPTFFIHCKDFSTPLPCLHTAQTMFWNGPLESFSANLPNLTSAIDMFKGCEKLHTFDSTLPNLEFGDGMFSGCHTLTSFDAELPKIKTAGSMFKETALRGYPHSLETLSNAPNMFRECTTFSSGPTNLDSLQDGSDMFNATKMTEWRVNLPSITTGNGMFYTNSELETINFTMPNMRWARRMFENCKKLSNVEIDARSLENSCGMFARCESLRTLYFQGPCLSNLSNAQGMFEGCSKLDGWDVELQNLQYGRDMFKGCISLRWFTQTLPKLKDGKDMFLDCQLPEGSVTSILNSLPVVSNHPTITVNGPISITDESSAIYQSILNAQSNGWTVEHNFIIDIEDELDKKVRLAIEGHDTYTCQQVGQEAANSGRENYMYAGAKTLQEAFAVNYDYCDYDETNNCIFTYGPLSLETVDTNLMSLGIVENAGNPFPNCKRFLSPMPSLSGASTMFARGPQIIEFSSYVPNLTAASGMFVDCPNLKTVNTTFPSLIYGDDMFKGCDLDEDSIIRILTGLPPAGNESVITIQSSIAMTAAIQDAITEAENKGWVVDHNLIGTVSQ